MRNREISSKKLGIRGTISCKASIASVHQLNVVVINHPRRDNEIIVDSRVNEK